MIILNQAVSKLSQASTHMIRIESQIICYTPDLSVIIDKRSESAILRKILIEIPLLSTFVDIMIVVKKIDSISKWFQEFSY